MKLYYSPGACALASQIVLREAGIKFDLVKVDLAAKLLPDGGDYRKLNPKGYVPALQDDSGEIYTEGSVILQRIADQASGKSLLPKFGTKERYHAMEWLNFVATELHKGFSVLYNKALNDEARSSVVDRLHLRFQFLDNHLRQHGPFVLGKEFSAVDAYIYNIIRWSRPHKIDMSNYSGINTLMENVASRPSAQAALEAEGLRQ